MNDTTQSEWRTAEPTKKPPVPDEEAIRNIRESVKYDYPILAPQPRKEGSMIFVAAGPSVRKYLPEIKRRREAGEYVMTCNHTHDWLVDQGIIPHACLILDPREDMKDAVQKVQSGTAYMISSCANPKVWEEMAKRGASMMKIMVAYGMNNDEDMKVMTELYPHIAAKYYLPGGTMTPLRAMPLAAKLGYKKIEMYGFDSCYAQDMPGLIYEGQDGFRDKKSNHIVYKDDKGNFIIDEPEDGGFYYAYKKRRRENMQDVEYKGRTFLSSPVLIHQAMQITKWYDRLDAQLDIVIHGDSLSSWVLETHKKELQENKDRIGDRRWTDEYAEQMRLLHEQGHFGIHGYTDIEWASRAFLSLLCTLQRPIKVIDYGAGAGTFADAVHKVFKMVEVTSYDPFHPRFKDDPEPGVHDAVSCNDVLEHVEIECVDNTLKYIADRAKFMACFSIGIEDAIKTLPDGRNAHITQKSPEWWAGKLREHFTIVEYLIVEGMVLFVCQPLDLVERVKADGALERKELGGRLSFASKIGGV